MNTLPEYKNIFLTHSHSDASNFRLRDAINKITMLVDYTAEIGLKGFVCTDHEALSNHVKLLKYVKKQKEAGKLPDDYSIGLGNEIYLLDRDKVEDSLENGTKIKYPHFILIAKNERGYKALKILSSKAWKNGFYQNGMFRVPTYKDDLYEIMQEYSGDLIATTACVGGELPQYLIAYDENPSQELKKKMHEFITLMKGLFGTDFYFELQPSYQKDQHTANRMLLKLSEVYNVKCIVATDAHYLNKSFQDQHRAYLQASEGEREVDQFYGTTYVMSYDELLEFFPDELLRVLAKNTIEIQSKIESYSLDQPIKVPNTKIPADFTEATSFDKFTIAYNYIGEFKNSPNLVDRYYLKLIEEGMVRRNEEYNHENLDRINTELNEIWHISKALNQPLSSYFTLTKQVVDIMWKVSLVGVSRGSASCYYTNYLLDIVQINPIKYKLPHWRFLSKERPELPDVDIDTEGSKRLEIVELIKKEFGEENVLNMGTFTTEKSRSSVLTACRGLDIDKDIAMNIANLIPKEKAENWPIRDCLFGNEEEKRRPVQEFINEVDSHEGLRDALLSIEGLISGRSQHASGIVIFPNGYIEQNVLMQTTKGLAVTQFDAKDTEALGGLKLDFLSVDALGRIREAMALLEEYGKIEWQGTLRETYEKYLHPDVLEMQDPQMYEMLAKGEVFNAFQFETNVGISALNKIKPQSFDELSAGNSLMRLTTSGKQPIDKYVEFKNDISLWHKEMDENNLTEDEKNILIHHLNDRYGICDTQEGLMEISMDQKISGFTLTQANKFRKAVAKQNKELIAEQKELFFEQGKDLGTSVLFLSYVWTYCLEPQFG